MLNSIFKCQDVQHTISVYIKWHTMYNKGGWVGGVQVNSEQLSLVELNGDGQQTLAGSQQASPEGVERSPGLCVYRPRRHADHVATPLSRAAALRKRVHPGRS